MKKIYRINARGRALEKNIIRCGELRITLLTPAMLRIEYNLKRVFVDEPTQTVWFRDFPNVEHYSEESEESLSLETSRISLKYNKCGKAEDFLTIRIKDAAGKYSGSWKWNDKTLTLKGTARTLDEADGAIELEEGIISRQGYSVLDDSASYLIKESGELVGRSSIGKDIYFFGYGHAYQECLKDFFRLTGNPPMLPRFAFGNWWSRYYKYTEEKYKELIEKFEENEIPLSVAIIDMDWHITEIESGEGSGWTGYTWNRELFPDPERLISWLHEKKLQVSLNVHPAEGVLAHEEAYEQMADALGVDTKRCEPIAFNISDPQFIEAYFKYLHAPNEMMGVNFWWIDWQQGEKCGLPGVDPLWLLNHYHYLDNGKKNKRALILSRYGGVGSHRYPVGFSGDSIISWKTLDFQPYFTANAANIGYGWWSHDIGGHMLGAYDEELQIRWVQFGVFSPICRIHSSANPFNHKEPWNYSVEANLIITKYLRLRHQLIPYLYTINRIFSLEGIPPLRPLYYEYPEKEEAYHMQNEYFFGTQMICVPITTPIIDVIQAAKVSAWIPEGIYIDWFTGLIYKGERRINLYRGIGEMPVLLRAGAIVPLNASTKRENGVDNPGSLELVVAAGADGEFELYEDDGISLHYEDGEYVTTRFVLDYRENGEFRIGRANGDLKVIPGRRKYRISFLGFDKPKTIWLKKEDILEEISFCYDTMRNEAVLELEIGVTEEICISFEGGMHLGSNKVKERCFLLLDKAQIEYSEKEKIYYTVIKNTCGKVLTSLLSLNINNEIYEAIHELLLAEKE
ncbi:MAG: DUF5110 domain-containing protein [Clostridiales bacterium]|nr:DUF5110 domain-containing protein [Clostridiales bacterium]